MSAHFAGILSCVVIVSLLTRATGDVAVIGVLFSAAACGVIWHARGLWRAVGDALSRGDDDDTDGDAAGGSA